jgi:hypothetical protein
MYGEFGGCDWFSSIYFIIRFFWLGFFAVGWLLVLLSAG